MVFNLTHPPPVTVGAKRQRATGAREGSRHPVRRVFAGGGRPVVRLGRA